MDDDFTTGAHSRQDFIAQFAILLPELTRLVAGLNTLAEHAIRIGANDQAQKILGRVLSLADAAWIPGSGSFNVSALATLLDLSDRSVERMLERKNIPASRPGKERMIRAEDIERHTLDSAEGD